MKWLDDALKYSSVQRGKNCCSCLIVMFKFASFVSQLVFREFCCTQWWSEDLIVNMP